MNIKNLLRAKAKMLAQVAASVACLLLLSGVLLADTLYLKNGSVLKGTFVGFENGEFIFQITSGDSRNQGRTLRFPVREVSRLVLDREGIDNRDDRRDDRDDRGMPRRDPGGSGGNTGNTGGRRWNSYPTFDVRLADQWIRSQIEVVNGQRVRVDATGTVTLEGRTNTGPDGLSGRRDPDAPLPEQNDGALVAAIGNDPNSPAIYIGRSREFTADRDGVLYFTVNHWETSNARGAFQVRVQVEETGGGTSSGGTNSGGTGGGNRGQDRSFRVNANQAWLDTGIAVEPGMSIDITAEGTIQIQSRRSTGPEGDINARVSGSRYPAPNAGVGALLTKVRYNNGGDSQIVVVGSGTRVTVEPGEYGRLYLGINDDYLNDNQGSFTVRVRW